MIGQNEVRNHRIATGYNTDSEEEKAIGEIRGKNAQKIQRTRHASSMMKWLEPLYMRVIQMKETSKTR